jgi:hypothetical protein
MKKGCLPVAPQQNKWVDLISPREGGHSLEAERTPSPPHRAAPGPHSRSAIAATFVRGGYGSSRLPSTVMTNTSIASKKIAATPQVCA